MDISLVLFPLRVRTTDFHLETCLDTHMIEKVLNNYLMARSSCFHQRSISIHRLPREKKHTGAKNNQRENTFLLLTYCNWLHLYLSDMLAILLHSGLSINTANITPYRNRLFLQLHSYLSVRKPQDLTKQEPPAALRQLNVHKHTSRSQVTGIHRTLQNEFRRCCAVYFQFTPQLSQQ